MKKRRLNRTGWEWTAMLGLWALLFLNGFGLEHFGFIKKLGIQPQRAFAGTLDAEFQASSQENDTDGAAPEAPKNQVDQYNAQVSKTVVELQQYRTSASAGIPKDTGQEGTVTLLNLNPSINRWFLLFLQRGDGQPVEAYHLENPMPGTQNLLLDPGYPEGLMIATKQGSRRCALWSAFPDSEVGRAAASGKIYAPLCGEQLLLRNKTEGNKTTLEQVTDLLRNHVWEGEKITTFVRETFYQDKYLNTSDIIAAGTLSAETRPRTQGAPASPLTNPRYSNDFLTPGELGIDLDCETGNNLLIGRWYRARGLPGVFVSVIEPDLVAEEIIASQRKQVNPLDDVESKALVYMIAFDLDLFDLGFEMGTEHPRVDWSDRVQDQVRDNTIPGPDGIGDLEPLKMTGLLSPVYKDRVAVTFVGGFKRFHGAFRWSGLAFRNHGSHYGFIQHGTVLSKLQPHLSTVVVFKDGTVDLKTWTEKDNADLWRIRHARQNGLPILDYDPETGASRVGAMVPRWANGNWSGSADKRFRTVRAGLGLQENEGRRFLIYGYFSAATPSAMARVFQAYQCRYALMMDINALEHTYLAVYQNRGAEFWVQHLVKGMSVLDKTREDKIIPRFVDYPDNRDFFYLLKKVDP